MDGWFQRFLARHQELTQRKCQSISIASANVTYKDIVYWFQNLGEQCEHLKVFNIFSHPNRAFNMDEIPFQLSPKDVKVVSIKNTQYNMKQTACEGKKMLTVLACASADGTMVPPLIIFRKSVPKTVKNLEKKYNQAYTSTQRGWNNQEKTLY